MREAWEGPRIGGTLAVLAAALLASGCVTMGGHVPLAQEERGKLGELTVRSVVVQDEVVLTAPEPGVVQAAGGGLLAALVESSIVKERQDALQGAIEPFYSQIDDYDFRREFWSALVPFLRSAYPLPVANVVTTPVTVPKFFADRWAADLPAGKAVMVLRTRYTFADQFRRLDIETDLDLWQRGKQQPTFANVYRYQSATVGSGERESINQWSANGGARYRQALAEGIQETLRMLRLDAEGATGEVLEPRPGRAIARSKDGRLVSSPR
ncbi:MAG: hypothetical protein ACT4P9_01425 [Betaproteobacteria bacterium]